MTRADRAAEPMHGALAEIVELAETTRAASLDMSRDLTQEQLDFRPDPDSWSVGEVLDHLAKVEKGIARLLQVKLAEARAAEPSADPPAVPSQLASLDRFQIATNPVKLKSPDRVAPRYGVPRAELFAALDTTRRELREATRALASYDLTRHTFPHPALGELNLYQWLLFVAQHERRHATQINSIVTDPRFPAAAEKG